MSDGRKNNGGHSTKAKGVDKRKNENKAALAEAATPEEIKNVVKMLYTKAVKDKDVKAAVEYLRFTVGNPQQQTDITTDGEKIGNGSVIINFDAKAEE